jgi:putative colanic acid biosynthesis acetyltransferase WcaF
MSLDIDAARRARPYSNTEYLGRVLWMFAQPFFRWSPRPLFGWRRLLLRCFGARVAAGANVYPSVRIEIPWNLELGEGAAIGDRAWIYNLGPVRIGARATVSHNAHLCAGSHDYRDPALPLLRLPIVVGAEAWICAQAFVAPGSVIGEGAVVGAGAVASGDIEAWTVVAGNPARFVKRRELKQSGE